MRRREFLQISLIGGGALALGFTIGGCGGANREKRMRALAHSTGTLKPNAMIAVNKDSRVRFGLGKAEMGQGVATGYAMLVAEELGVRLDAVDFEFANGPDFATVADFQFTGGSTSMAEGFMPVREAAATAREMLIKAAARKWGVEANGCDVVDGEVVHAASGKRAAIGELTVLAASEAIPGKPRLRDPKDFKIIGKRGTRRDVLAKVTGEAGFGIDVSVPGMVCAVMIHPPVWGARARQVTATAARGMTGVIDVFATRFGVAVVAEKYWQARRAAARVEVDWGKGKVEGYNTGDLLADALAYRGHGRHVRDDGSVDRDHGGQTVTATYQFPYLAHACMEPQNCTVKVDGGKVEVWAPTQSPTIAAQAVASLAGIDRSDVTVHTTYLGGGFGRRFAADYVAQAYVIAAKVKRPVKMIWSRESDMQGGYYRPFTVARCRGAVAGGKLVSYDQHTIGQPILISQGETVDAGMPDFMPTFFAKLFSETSLALFSTNSVADIMANEGAADTVYKIPNLRVRYTPINVAIPVQPWRSVGHSYTGFVVESFVDEAAHAAGIDPFEFRRAHLEEGSRERGVLEAVAADAGWGKARPAPGFAFGIAQHHSFDSYAAEVVEAGVIDGEIQVRRVWCAIDCGIAVSPDVIRAQMESGIIYGLSAALWQEITFRDGVVEQGNFDTYRVMRMNECPQINVRIIESTEKPTGVGEPGLPPIGPALANAIFAQTGVRLRELPLQKAWDRLRGGKR